jgi:hypothetical protein
MAQDYYTARELKILQGEQVSEDDDNKAERGLSKEADDKDELLPVSEAEGERIRFINLKWQTKIRYEKSEFVPHSTLHKLFYWRIKKHCKLFTSFCLVGTVLLIAHANIISLFSILTGKWVKHFFYESEIIDIFRGANQNSITALFKD